MRPSAETSRPAARPAETFQIHLGEVIGCDGLHWRVQTSSGPLSALLATHVPGVVPGQQVVLQCPPKGLPVAALIVAAYPLGRGQAPVLDYQAASDTLKISATRLELNGLDAVTLRCGEASIQLNLNGELSCQADRILSAAWGTHRIEGASVEIN